MYLIKLKIEMNMADLIVKIVRATSPPPDHELHRYAASSNPNIDRPDHPSRSNTDASKETTTSAGTYISRGGDLGTLPLSPTTLLNESLTSDRGSTRRASEPCWELKQMSSHFDVQDVVYPQSQRPLSVEHLQQQQQQQQRKVSFAEGSVGSCVGLMPLRPPLGGRNFSELTQLELGAGYVAKEKRDSLLVDREQSQV